MWFLWVIRLFTQTLRFPFCLWKFVLAGLYIPEWMPGHVPFGCPWRVMLLLLGLHWAGSCLFCFQRSHTQGTSHIQGPNFILHNSSFKIESASILFEVHVFHLNWFRIIFVNRWTYSKIQVNFGVQLIVCPAWMKMSSLKYRTGNFIG